VNLIEIFIIAFGLAMDCFAVSLSSSICTPCLKRQDTLRIAFFFGLFQGGMPVLGWLIGKSFYDSVASIDHWIAFSILAIIGIKMIAEALKEANEKQDFNIKILKVLLWLSVATSIDAFVIGMSFAFLQVNIVTAIISIGLITFLMSVFGVFLGKKFGSLISSKWAEIGGGIILVGIGAKTLIQHLYFT
jgi:putative Mn2+ efflux pump MntP